MPAGFSQILKELDSGKWHPVYAIAGEEPFQTALFTQKLRQRFNRNSEEFNYDVFDAEVAAPADLVASLNTLPGLFDGPDTIRLVLCRRFEKAPVAFSQAVENYLKDPSPQTCFVIVTEKADRRKAWVKEVERLGRLLEVSEPYDRDWPKWKPFFEARIQKKIDPLAWEQLVEAGQRSLALVAMECEKAALYVGSTPEIGLAEAREIAAGGNMEDVFGLSEDVLAGRALEASLKLQHLLQRGESEIKILSIIVRHARQIAQCHTLMAQGVTDVKTLGAQIGVPPFFVPKIQQTARSYSSRSLEILFSLLAECDFRLKTGEGRLWSDLLVPHFRAAAS